MDVTAVPGLYILRDALSPQEEAMLLDLIDADPWIPNRDGLRRVQVFGPFHDADYKVRPSAKITPYPRHVRELAMKV